jgi:hypothetical protein
MATQTASPEISSALDPSTVPATVPSTGDAIHSHDSQAQPSRVLASSGLPEPSKNAKGHRPTCICTLCKRIQDRIASGKPSYAARRATQTANRLARQKVAAQSKRQPKRQPNGNRERRIARDAALEASLETQVVLGRQPNAKLAGQIAGIEPRTAQLKAKESNFVQSALEKVGITDDKLAEVAARGLDAKIVKIITDRDGNVIDAIEQHDTKGQHLFWRDILMTKGILGNDRDSQVASGGLIIIAPNEATVIEGHSPACVCEKCLAAWNEKTKVLSRNASRAMTVDAEIVENPRPLPENLESEDLGDGDEADESWAPSSS